MNSLALFAVAPNGAHIAVDVDGYICLQHGAINTRFSQAAVPLLSRAYGRATAAAIKNLLYVRDLVNETIADEGALPYA